MPGPTRKRKSTNNSDFNRIKAKVGKKALKPANVTDTSFKAASVAVRNQEDSFSTNKTLLLSEKGHSIQELATQLHHPAAAVRTSAIRGLGNIVDSHAGILKAHLSILLPAVVKCCVDEDDNVRQLGLTVIETILKAQEQAVFQPFVDLLTAYTASALNSLDRSTRLDGGHAVAILCKALPTLMGCQGETLLPAFVALLSDYSKQQQRKSTESTSSKKKRKKPGEESKRFTILEGLVALLQTIPHGGTSGSALNDDKNGKPDLVFCPGGRTINALLVAGRRDYQSVRPISNMRELSCFLVGDTAMVEKNDVTISDSVATDIALRLRDVFIELSQRGSGEGSRGGLVLGAADLEELALLNKAIRLFWNAYCCDMIRQQESDDGLRKVFVTILSLMMESFPLFEQSSNTDLAARAAALNADICATLMDIGGYLEADSKSTLDWTRRVLDYLLPRLEMAVSVSNQGGTVVNVLAKLLLLKQVTSEYSLSDKTRLKVLGKICSVFFADDLTLNAAKLASSRRAVLLIVELFKTEHFVVNVDTAFGASLQLTLKRLPFFLRAWRGDYLTESREVLAALLDVARRLNVESESSQDALESLRTGLSLSFEYPKRQRPRSGFVFPHESPVFELYSEEMQRQALGLLVMIGAPKEETINGLSYMCARCGKVGVGDTISPMIAGAVLYAVHSVRRSMSIQTYLSFVINSIGITNSCGKWKEKADRATPEADDDPDVDSEVLFDIDSVKATESSVLRAARSLILCGSSKVLPMIHKVLSGWLEKMAPDCDLDPMQRAIDFRAACAIVSMLVLDMNTVDDDTETNVSQAVQVPGFVSSICNVFLFCFSRGTSDHDSIDAFAYLMQPNVALMKIDKRLVESILNEASKLIGVQHQETSETTKACSAYIEGLLWIVRNAELAPILREASGALMECCESIQEALAGNSGLERQASNLRTAAELLIGNTQVEP